MKKYSSYNFKNLVFEGGGIKGIAYAGAMQVLEEKGILKNIERVAGSSVGAITASILSIGYTAQEISELLKKTDFADFKDDSFFIPFNIIRFYKRFGWFKGDKLKKWLQEVFKKKSAENITFRQLYELKENQGGLIKELYLTGTNLNNKTEIIMSKKNTPDMKIIDAVRISASIPLFFQAVEQNKQFFIDGGLYYNYPIDIFDKPEYLEEYKNLEKNSEEKIYNKETIGLRVDSQEEISTIENPGYQEEVKNLKGFVETLIVGFIDNANKKHLDEKDWHRTIYINCGKIKATQFSLKDEQKEDLIKKGKDSALQYFDWFDNSKAKEKPLNK